MVELLSPVGDFECLKAAVQNGANAVYFGGNLFSARAFATNFNDEELEKAINYAKLRGVKTNLTLNTLIKDEEFEQAFTLAKKAYTYGIDAILVQDLGLAMCLIRSFPDLAIHASTQMTITNLDGVKKLEELGFKRVVLSRECSLKEIENICKNSKIEIEVFMHGALCISYSGECLFSSMVGGRSGNRGKCAQPCRLPYTLLDDNNKTLDRGYLLSTKDLCTLEHLPDLIKAGVASFKIEGRMKSPTYVATVTRIYRKYIDLATKFVNKEISKYNISPQDKNDLLQVFNRGGFSSGHLSSEPNKDLIFKSKPNNMGIYLGKIIKYNSSKGLITVKLENNVSLGDSISFENEESKYTISELMDKKSNIKVGNKNQTVTFGRMKGNIKVGDNIYKITDKSLANNASESFSKENRKNFLDCKLKIHSNEKVHIFVKCNNFSLEDSFEYNYIPDIAKNAPIMQENIIKQFKKTLNTCFEFSTIEISLDDNLFIPTSVLNDIRRETISRMETKIIQSFKRNFSKVAVPDVKVAVPDKKEISILLNVLNSSLDYNNLKSVDRIYIPLKYFLDKKYEEIVNTLSTKGKLYIYMPTIIKDSFTNLIINNLNVALNNFNIYGIVVSNLSELKILERINLPPNVDLIANYTFNVFNKYTINELLKMGFSKITLSPEEEANSLSMISPNTELIVSGNIPIMHTSYCLLGRSNKCYGACKKICKAQNKFYLKDRYGFNFRIIPDNVQTITTIYNSRSINIDYSKLNASIRIDILD